MRLATRRNKEVFPSHDSAVAAVLVVGVAGCSSSATSSSASSSSAPKTTYTAKSVTNANTSDVSDKLVRQDTPDKVLAEHMRALNGCDWKGLMAQYPDNYEMRGPSDATVKGRDAAGTTFAGFVKPHAQGGLCGLTFKEESRQVVGNTIAVQWVANADFLTQPYEGSDAYIRTTD